MSNEPNFMVWLSIPWQPMQDMSITIIPKRKIMAPLPTKKPLSSFPVSKLLVDEHMNIKTAAFQLIYTNPNLHTIDTMPHRTVLAQTMQTEY